MLDIETVFMLTPFCLLEAPHHNTMYGGVLHLYFDIV